jgi:hypothetical protein
VNLSHYPRSLPDATELNGKKSFKVQKPNSLKSGGWPKFQNQILQG